MKKNKISLMIFLSALVLVLGAMLPRIVSWIVDAVGSNQVTYSQISAVSLEFDESGIPLQEKLPLLASAEWVQVSTSMASHTTQEIQDIAAAAIERYSEAGLLPSAVDISYSASIYPYLAYASYDPSSEMRSNLFWDVSITPRDSGPYMHMVLDDQTGAVCTLEYQSGGKESAFPLVEQQDKLSIFCDLYLEGLGEEFAECTPEFIPRAQDEAYTGAKLAFTDSGYGDYRIALIVYEHGFYAYIT